MPRSRQPTLPASPRWLVRGDLDGFLGLALDNLIQILLIIALCRGVLGYPDELIFGVILPAAGLSLLVGNGAYSIQAHRLARLEGRDDRTALPYGINTVSLFAYVFLVMLPVKLAALGEGLSAEQAVQLSWRAGLLACLGSGLIEARRRLLRGSPAALAAPGRPALHPGRHRPGLHRPGLSVAHLCGAGGGAGGAGGDPDGLLRQRAPAPARGPAGGAGGHRPGLGHRPAADRQHHLAGQRPAAGLAAAEPPPGERSGPARDQLLPWIGVIDAHGAVQRAGFSAEHRERRGGRRPLPGARSSLLINGVGTTVAAALLGSCFPTTIYIGHPGWKGMGASIGYSWLNGLVMGLGCLFGLFGLVGQLVPIEAGMAIVLYIGIW
jgi:AGZA family xanthine/uracil permease-like MFS transporter